MNENKKEIEADLFNDLKGKLGELGITMHKVAINEMNLPPAILAALTRRTRITHGAVSMVETAINRIENGALKLALTQEQKAQITSNMLFGLCNEKGELDEPSIHASSLI